MDFGLAFTYPFQDQDWIKKIGIAALVSLIPVVGGMILMGWVLEIVRRVIRHDPQPLAEWDGFGKYLSDGFMLVIIFLIYAIPFIIVFSVGIGIAQIPLLMANEDNAGGIMGIVGLFSMCIYCVSMIYIIIFALISPAVTTNFAVKGTFGAGFNFSEIIALFKAAPSAYIICFLGVIVAGFIASLGTIACFIGVIFTSAYAYAIEAHLYGQTYLASQAALGNPSAQS